MTYDALPQKKPKVLYGYTEDELQDISDFFGKAAYLHSTVKSDADPLCAKLMQNVDAGVEIIRRSIKRRKANQS